MKATCNLHRRAAAAASRNQQLQEPKALCENIPGSPWLAQQLTALVHIDTTVCVYVVVSACHVDSLVSLLVIRHQNPTSRRVACQQAQTAAAAATPRL